MLHRIKIIIYLVCITCFLNGCADKVSEQPAKYNLKTQYPENNAYYNSYFHGAGISLRVHETGSVKFVADNELPGINIEIKHNDNEIVKKNVVQVFSIKNKTLSSVYKYLKPRNHDSSSSVVSDIHYCDFYEIVFGREGVIRFVLKPSGDALYLYNELSKNMAIPSTCGGWGIGNSGMRYFEIFDTNPDKAVFVEIGQEKPLFDEKSLILTN